jgi:glycosyltransferase involved in cell wall biosynthesis
VKLSIIIVSYNVKVFLEQALFSVQNACKNIDAEVFVVDNKSSDDSVDMVKKKFPAVTLIVNDKNVGFSTANNQAIKRSTGDYILLLNPDTLVAEDTFEKCIACMEKDLNIGALGVKMIDGTGMFLPESKRGLPTPWVSFCKIFGLSAFFPQSTLFSRYHLGYLSKEENHDVDVLSGAYMFMRKEAIEKAGLLDESFFMYGEDIDLSYRILKAGYKNYYFAETTIIHYKGESTKKGSLNYVRAFYEAMIIYAKKHFSQSKAGVYSFIIKLAIYIKAIISISTNFFKVSWLPIFDFIISFVGIYFIKEVWENKIMHDDNYYDDSFLFVFIPLYLLVWLVSAYLLGAYDKPIKSINIIKGIGSGTLILTAAFGLLPNEYRFSRAIILIGALWMVFALFFNRLLYQAINSNEVVFKDDDEHKIAIVGDGEEANRALTLLNETGIPFMFSGFVSVLPSQTKIDNNSYLCSFEKTAEICGLLKIDEIVFCNKSITAKNIILFMEKMKTAISYKTIPDGGYNIIGSNSKNTAGDVYAIDVNLKIGRPSERRNKRVLDLVLALFFLLFLPLFFICFSNRNASFKNLLSILLGKKTWVGYATNNDRSPYRLPRLRVGFLSPLDEFSSKDDALPEIILHKINLQYAKDYSVYNDLMIVYKATKK